VSFWSAVAVALAGTGAGIINTIVGSGTLITFPTLLFFGVNPLVANVSNNIGLVAGGITGSWGYRHELGGQAPTLRRLMPLSFVGSVVGAGLLLVLPASAFRAIVPVLILIALVLVVAGPVIQARAHPEGESSREPRWHAPAVAVGVFVAGMYGGYFGAAQGVLLVAILGVGLQETMQRNNATKNVLALLVNLVAALVFIAVADVDWAVAGLIALGSVIGGQIGATVGRRLPSAVLRAVIVLVGVVAIVSFVLG
jgi:uncharacterized protein